MKAKTAKSLVLIAFLTLLSPGVALADTKRPASAWPLLIAKTKSAECAQILKAAKIAFNSTASELDLDSDPIRKGNVGLVLAPIGREEGAQGNQTFWFDEKYIDSNKDVTESESKASQYWQKSPSNGGIFVVDQKPMNWQGDWYDLCFVDADITKDKRDGLNDRLQKESQSEMKAIPEGMVIYSNLWHRPWLYHNSKSDLIVAVNPRADWLNDSGNYLPDWAIYAPAGGSKVKQIGIIRFGPRVSAFKLLPDGPLRELAKLLDKIIGIPKEDEGTFRATPRLRGEAAIAWANLALRPWALAEPANTKVEVEAGLKTWAKGSPIYKQQYAQLKSLYPQAEKSLANYYQTNGRMAPAAAARLAKSSLETAYRSNFKF